MAPMTIIAIPPSIQVYFDENNPEDGSEILKHIAKNVSDSRGISRILHGIDLVAHDRDFSYPFHLSGEEDVSRNLRLQLTDTSVRRLGLSDEDLEKFTSEFDAILKYVGQLEKLDLPKGEGVKPVLRNVMRNDGEPHASGIYTEKLAEQFPQREGNALAVKQIIQHD